MSSDTPEIAMSSDTPEIAMSSDLNLNSSMLVNVDSNLTSELLSFLADDITPNAHSNINSSTPEDSISDESSNAEQNSSEISNEVNEFTYKKLTNNKGEEIIKYDHSDHSDHSSNLNHMTNSNNENYQIVENSNMYINKFKITIKELMEENNSSEIDIEEMPSSYKTQIFEKTNNGDTYFSGNFNPNLELIDNYEFSKDIMTAINYLESDRESYTENLESLVTELNLNLNAIGYKNNVNLASEMDERLEDAYNEFNQTTEEMREIANTFNETITSISDNPSLQYNYNFPFDDTLMTTIHDISV
jgi:hypothetical protein